MSRTSSCSGPPPTAAPLAGLALVGESGLGELRPGAGLDATVVDPPSQPGDARVVIARTDAAATIHRPARMLCVCVRPPGEGLEYRFVGLLGSAAYRESVFAIPVLAERATEVLELSGAPLHSHTGRAIKNVVETLPRDLVFELDAHVLAQLVIDIVGLQERRIVRAFDVAEPVGPWTTVLVYVPRTRFTAALPETVAALVAEHYAGEVRDSETLVGTSSLARISMSVRAGRDVDLERLGHAIDRISETWEEQARRAVTDALGPEEGDRVFDLLSGATTAEYRARTRPIEAVADFRQIAALLGSSTAIATSFGRAVDADGDDWRFRVYFRGPGATLADLVPVLGQLGLQAVEEHPVTFDIDGDPVSLYEIGVRAGRDHIDELQRMELRRAFVGLVLGTIESDQLNHLVLEGGLEIRQVGVLRLYHRYLGQVGFRFSSSYTAQTLVRQPEIARLLAELFDARFDPARGNDAVARATAVADVRTVLLERLDEVPVTRRGPDLPCLSHRDRRHRPDERLPLPLAGRRRDRGEAATRRDPVPSRAAPTVRDLRVLAEGRRRPPAWRADRPGRPAVERSRRGLPHGDPRPDEGADGEERRDRAGRRQGRVRGEGRDGRPDRPRCGA